MPEIHIRSRHAYSRAAESDSARARLENEIALADAPNNTGVISDCVWFLWQQGDMKRAHALLPRTYELDWNGIGAAWLTYSYFCHRDFEQAQRWNEITLLHDRQLVRYTRDIPLYGLGDTARYREICEKEPVDPQFGPGSWRYYPPWQFTLALYARDYPAAMKLANEAKILDWPVQEVTADLSRALLFRITRVYSHARAAEITTPASETKERRGQARR